MNISDVNLQPGPALISIGFGPGTDIDAILAALGENLSERGLNVAGLIQKRGEPKPDCACREMHLRDLASGKSYLISESRGPEASGCHLDWQALTNLAQALEKDLSETTDVLIINRFGRSESEGRGFRGAIEKAMMLGIQVVVACRDEYGAQWRAFHGGLATECSPDVLSLLETMNLLAPQGYPSAACENPAYKLPAE